jgi:membrane protease YdiL (CAAX protease family)
MGSEQREKAESLDGRRVGSGFLGRWWEQVFGAPLRSIDQESRAFLASERSRRPDWKVMIVMVTAAASLTIHNFFGHLPEAWRTAYLLDLVGLNGLAQAVLEYQRAGGMRQLNGLTWWAASSILTYVVPAALVVKLLFRERFSDYGLKLRGALKDFWIYGVMFLVMVPLIFVVSNNAHFKQTYPFYRVAPGEALGPDFWQWEAMYFCQFWALEFFFRGFLVHGTRHRFGLYSVFAMMVPYCMIHFAKPLPECCGSIVAGIVLGFMSLKTRSIWLGAAIHVTVALTMDFASLWRQGFFS